MRVMRVAGLAGGDMGTGRAWGLRERSITAYISGAAAFCALAATCAVPGRAQDSFTTELKLAADRTKVRAERVHASDEKRIAAVLEKRLPILTRRGGTVQVKTMDDIRVRVPADALDPSRIRMFTRAGQFIVRHLADVQ